MESNNKPLFNSGHSLAKWVSILFGILLLLKSVVVVLDFYHITLIGRFINRQAVTIAEIASNEDRLATISSINFLPTIIGLVLFVVWVYRIYGNLPSFGADNLRFSPGWAVAGFFIPIWNIFHPYLVLREVWKASDPTINMNEGLKWENAPTSFLITIWWLLFLLSIAIGTIISFIAQAIESPEALYSWVWVAFSLDVLGIFYVISAILMVQAIDSRQTKKKFLLIELQAKNQKVTS